jgi:thiamine pyrophosphate-dependent acetolactate synthase large subunit-like protein
VLAGGAQTLIRTLLELGVDTIFGYSGAKVLPFFDALYAVSGDPLRQRTEPTGTASDTQEKNR